MDNLNFESMNEGSNIIVLVSKPEKKEKIVCMNPKTPPRTDAIQNNGPSPIPYFQESVNILEKMGASFIVAPSNTSHYFFRFLKSKVSLLSMITETARAIRAQGYRRIGLLATTGTIQTRLYHDELEKYGIEVLTPTDLIQADSVMEAIIGKNGVKAGNTSSIPQSLVLEAAKDLAARGAEALILGCTELPLLIKEKTLSFDFNENELIIPVIDPTEILANVANNTSGIIGILGGQGPAATVDFLNKIGDTGLSSLLSEIIHLTRYSCDQDHHKMIGISVNHPDAVLVHLQTFKIGAIGIGCQIKPQIPAVCKGKEIYKRESMSFRSFAAEIIKEHKQSQCE